MKKIFTFLIVLLLLCNSLFSQVLISEFHYDNTGADVNERIEVFGPAGTNLGTYSLVLYNGTGGVSYSTIPLTGVIPNNCTINGSNYGVLVFNAPAIQNGSPDGIALVNGTTVIEFISYEGSFTATNGPANGMASTDVGVSEDGSGTANGSIQRVNNTNSWTVSPTTNTFGACNTMFALPITLKSFSASYKNNKVNIDWTASSTNIAEYFEVERSGDGRKYAQFKKVNVRTLDEADYSVTDENPASGISFYRLKMVDIDGRITYSKIAKITTSPTGVMLNSIYPNPASNKLIIEWNSSQNGQAQLIISDVIGRTVNKLLISSQEGFNQHTLPLEKLNKGHYLLQLSIDGEIFHAKFSKQ